jgi:hypothetical protein
MTVRLSIKVQPGSSKNRILGETAGEWKIAVTAPPVDGRANAAVIELLAEWLGVSRSAIRIVRGETGRRKVIEVLGISAAAAAQRLAALK